MTYLYLYLYLYRRITSSLYFWSLGGGVTKSAWRSICTKRSTFTIRKRRSECRRTEGPPPWRSAGGARSGAPVSDSGAERSLTPSAERPSPTAERSAPSPVWVPIHVKVKEAPAPSAMPSWEVERWQRTLAAYRAEHDPSTVVPHMQTRDMGEPVEVREAKG